MQCPTSRRSGAQLLAEVIYAVEQLPPEPSAYPAIYDLAVTCDQSGFFESSLVLYDRCLRIAISDDDRQTAYANLTAAYWAAAAAEPDPDKRSRHLRDGLYAATAALDPEGGHQVRATCVALAHRAVLFAELGHHDSALTDARRARVMAAEHGLHREQVVAMVGEVIARWHSSLDTTVLTLIAEIRGIGRGSRCRRLPAVADRSRGRRAVEPGAPRRGSGGAATRHRTSAHQAALPDRRPLGERSRRRQTDSVRLRSVRPMC